MFFWSAEGHFDPSSDNSCSTWADFRVDVSFSPGKPQGRCLVDLKAQERHLIPEGGSLNEQEDLASHFIILSVSRFWQETAYTGRELLKGLKSHLDFFSHCKIKKKKKEAESQNTLIRFCLYYCVFSLPLESTKHFIWNLWPWFLKAGAKSKYLIFDKLLKVKWNCSYSAYKSYSDGHYGNPYSKQAVLAVAKCGKFFDTYADKNPTEINSFSGYDTIKITEFYFFPHQQHLCWFM